MKISKLYLVAVLFFASIINLNAQSDSLKRKKVVFGVKAGLNYNLINSSDIYFNGLGAHLGGTMDLNLSKFFNFRFELLGSLRYNSFSEERSVLSIPMKNEVVSSPIFVTLPLLYRYHITDKISVMAGPQFDFLAYSKNTQTLTINGTETITETSFDNRLDFGFDLSGEYLLNKSIYLEFRYYKSLLSITQSAVEDTYNVFQLSAVYKFN